MTPSCDMDPGCIDPVTHIDQDGFVYCEAHGLSRRTWQPCRKLRPHELRRIERGDQVTRY